MAYIYTYHQWLDDKRVRNLSVAMGTQGWLTLFSNVPNSFLFQWHVLWHCWKLLGDTIQKPYHGLATYVYLYTGTSHNRSCVKNGDKYYTSYVSQGVGTFLLLAANMIGFYNSSV